MSQSLALQIAIRNALVSSPDVVELVPVDHILDTHRRPPPSPSVILGEDYGGPDEGNLGRDRVELFADLHIWAEGQDMELAKRIGGAVRRCLTLDPRPVLGGGYHLADWEVYRGRVLRDPGGKMAHGILTVRAVIGGGP